MERSCFLGEKDKETTTTTTTFIIFTIDKIKVHTQPAVSNS